MNESPFTLLLAAYTDKQREIARLSVQHNPDFSLIAHRAVELIHIIQQFPPHEQVRYLIELHKSILSGQLMISSTWRPSIELSIVSIVITLGESHNGQSVQTLINPFDLAVAHRIYADITAYYRLETIAAITAHRRRADELRNPHMYQVKRIVRTASINYGKRVIYRLHQKK